MYLSTKSPLRVPLDAFTEVRPSGARRPRWLHIAAVSPALLVVYGVLQTGSELASGSALLSAISILTGFMFSMAMVFWSKSVDARRDPQWYNRPETLNFLDWMRSHLIFTTFVGVVAAILATLLEVFQDALQGSVVMSSMVAGATTYLLTLVLISLKNFNTAFFILKR